jgi:hypothetical protein
METEEMRNILANEKYVQSSYLVDRVTYWKYNIKIDIREIYYEYETFWIILALVLTELQM